MLHRRAKDKFPVSHAKAIFSDCIVTFSHRLGVVVVNKIEEVRGGRVGFNFTLALAVKNSYNYVIPIIYPLYFGEIGNHILISKFYRLVHFYFFHYLIFRLITCRMRRNIKF